MEQVLINIPDMGGIVRSTNPQEELASNLKSLNFFYDLNAPI